MPDQPLIGARVPSEYVKGTRRDGLWDVTIGMPPPMTWVKCWYVLTSGCTGGKVAGLSHNESNWSCEIMPSTELQMTLSSEGYWGWLWYRCSLVGYMGKKEG